MPPNFPALRSPSDVAREKGVGRHSVYAALNRGTLTEYHVANGPRLVVSDEKLDAYLARPPQPGPPGRDGAQKRTGGER